MKRLTDSKHGKPWFVIKDSDNADTMATKISNAFLKLSLYEDADTGTKGEVRMERLTYRKGNMTFVRKDIDLDDPIIIATRNRLADYEDTGLSPEEIVELKKFRDVSDKYEATKQEI